MTFAPLFAHPSTVGGFKAGFDTSSVRDELTRLIEYKTNKSYFSRKQRF